MNLKRIVLLSLLLLTLTNVAFIAPWVAEACTCGGPGGCTGNCCYFENGVCACYDEGSSPLCPGES